MPTCGSHSRSSTSAVLRRGSICRAGAPPGRGPAGRDVRVGGPSDSGAAQPGPGAAGAVVAQRAAGAGATTVAVRERAALTERVAETVRAGDVVFTLGAGDVTRVGP